MVSAIAVCPYNSNLIATGNYSSIVNIWDIAMDNDSDKDIMQSLNKNSDQCETAATRAASQNTYMQASDANMRETMKYGYNHTAMVQSPQGMLPIYSRRRFTEGWILGVAWDPYGCGIYVHGSDSPCVSILLSQYFVWLVKF